MLRNWLDYISIKTKIYFLIIALLLFYLLGFMISFGTLYLTSAMHSYIEAESLWSKAQKNAYISLLSYIRTHNVSDYNDFIKFMKIPLADKDARIELDKLISDHNLVYKKFLEAQNQPDDIYRMINLYYYFKEMPYLKDAIKIWTTADDLIGEILIQANLINDFILKNQQIPIRYILNLQHTNKQLTKLEEQFSRKLGEAARRLEYFAYKMLTVTLFFVITIIILMLLLILNALKRTIESFIRISNNIINNDFSERINISTRDELEQLAISFNQMIDSLEKSNQINNEFSMRLRESEERFRQAFEYAAIGMAIVSLDGHWLKVNRSLCNIVGYKEEELLNLTFQDITYPEDLETDMTYVNQLLEGTKVTYSMEKRYIRKDGSVIWILLSGSLVKDEYNNQPLYFLAQIQDINEQKKALTKLKDLSYLDILTNIYNKQSLYTKFAEYEQIIKDERLAICYLNLSNLKSINDKYGHKIGDLALKTVAKRLQTRLAETDLISRLSAAEFIMIFRLKWAQNNFDQLINDLIKDLAIPMSFNEVKIQVSVIIGISYFPDDGYTLDELIERASHNLIINKNLHN